MLKNKVTELLNAALEEKPTIFLIELAISGDNKITVTLDGDQGVNLQDCIDISRAIEHNLDREEIDFSLEVASAGACSALKFPRQYKKNIGRKLEVITTNGNKMTADITDATDEYVVLEWSSREPKKIGKGKETVNHHIELPYSEIKQAKVTIVF